MLQPALLASAHERTNLDFVTDDSFERALLGSRPSDATFISRQALYVLAFEKYLTSSDIGENEQRAARVPAFHVLYRTFLNQYAPLADFATLDQVASAGRDFAERENDDSIPWPQVAAASRVARLHPLDTIARALFDQRKRFLPLLVPALWLICIAALWIWPIGALRAEEAITRLRAADIPWLSKSLAVLFSVFRLHGRHVQDHWANAYLRSSSDTLLEPPAFMVPLPVMLRQDDRSFEPAPGLVPEQVKQYASKGRLHMLICGEGGSGKTALASYVATLLRHDDPQVRIWRHKAVAVGLTADIDPLVNVTGPAILSTIRKRLDDIAGRDLPVSEGLVQAMLGDGRILLVIDGLSEMPPAVVAGVKSFLATTQVTALIITSRSETVARERFDVTVRPQRLTSEPDLTRFINQYKAAHPSTSSQPSREIAAELSQITDGGATPLLLSLYLQMVCGPKRRGSMPDSMEGGMAEIVESYVKWLNDKVARAQRIPTDQVVAAARAIARISCLDSKSFRSSAADISAVRAELSPVLASRFDYFIEQLSLVKIVGDGGDRVRFEIDPVCEYLAGFYVTNLCLSDYSKSLAFLECASGAEERSALAEFAEKTMQCIQAELRREEHTVREQRTLRKLSADITRIQLESRSS